LIVAACAVESAHKENAKREMQRAARAIIGRPRKCNDSGSTIKRLPSSFLSHGEEGEIAFYSVWQSQGFVVMEVP